MTTKHSHYFKDVTRYDTIDVYRVLQLFGVTDPCIQHAVKKLLVAGGRGVKNIDKDVKEAIDSLNRFLQMQTEDLHESLDLDLDLHNVTPMGTKRSGIEGCGDVEIKCATDGREFQ